MSAADAPPASATASAPVPPPAVSAAAATSKPSTTTKAPRPFRALRQNTTPSRFVFVSKLPIPTQPKDLGEHLGSAGAIDRVDVQVDADGNQLGTAFVAFRDEDGAHEALKRFNQSDFQGQQIRVVFDRTLGQKAGKRPHTAPAAPTTTTTPATRVSITSEGDGVMDAPAPMANASAATEPTSAAGNASTTTRPAHAKKRKPAAASRTGAPSVSTNAGTTVPLSSSSHRTRPSANEPLDVAAIQSHVLWLGNLPYDLAWRDIKHLIESETNVAVSHVDLATDRESGKPLGQAAVTLLSVQDARDVAQALHGMDLGVPGRVVKVRPHYMHGTVHETLWVSGIPMTTKRARVRAVFEDHGFHVKSVNLIPAPHSFYDQIPGHLVRAGARRGSSGDEQGGEGAVRESTPILHRGYGTVVLSSVEDVERALAEMNGLVLGGRKLDVSRFSPDMRGKRRPDGQVPAPVQTQRQHAEQEQKLGEAAEASEATTPARTVTPPPGFGFDSKVVGTTNGAVPARDLTYPPGYEPKPMSSSLAQTAAPASAASSSATLVLPSDASDAKAGDKVMEKMDASAGESKPTISIYCGGLSSKTKWYEVRNWVRTHGFLPVGRIVLRNVFHKPNAMYALVAIGGIDPEHADAAGVVDAADMDPEEVAALAIAKLHGKLLHGRAVTVQRDRRTNPKAMAAAAETAYDVEGEEESIDGAVAQEMIESV
ncbi:hypothetical protein AMAG_09343 [Allomyces macrogynus ATCC 38327]|uniref:RRM domain-containing protein n=1 Tax=Allomyces macrogynus (strain ATCC 38327) TaxID=578462 RepID=A0A0L0SPI7_ALLM3|nr:hypothetical protein AMAG_09343 [Allomyces macrogynus ATCC 38327]|eukprot:KNE64314.1 hypothetical protein AMAG_09343 [Allomyces macrogynus ATCC 38327]